MGRGHRCDLTQLGRSGVNLLEPERLAAAWLALLEPSKRPAVENGGDPARICGLPGSDARDSDAEREPLKLIEKTVCLSHAPQMRICRGKHPEGGGVEGRTERQRPGGPDGRLRVVADDRLRVRDPG